MSDAWSGWSDRELAEELCEQARGLSDWEMDFADSIFEWANRSGRLTIRQRLKAIEILNRLEVRP